MTKDPQAKRKPENCAFVIFGVTGDLTHRLVMPSLYNLAAENLLPEKFCVVGVARKGQSDDELRDSLMKGLRQFATRPVDDDVAKQLLQCVTFVEADPKDPPSFDRLREHLDSLECSQGTGGNRLFYLATPPAAFAPTARELGRTGMMKENHAWRRLVIEKPFGTDLVSARALNAELLKIMDEHQIYRIDHYLGKETVQDLLVQRFANSIFEPLWNRNYIDSVQITVAEEVGVGTRGGYYEQSGALRDMIQNHTMQLVALTAMEPPVSLDAEAIRDEKVKLLRAIQPLDLSPRGDVVRAQYAAGMMGGKEVKGYLDEEGINRQSGTETYAGIRLSINNWRWQGVPFYLRSGKRMARRVTEIAVNFKRPPGTLFAEGERFNLAPNTLAFQIQPDEGLGLVLNGKVPGLETRTQPVKMNFRYSTTFGSNTPEAYERLVLDAMTGDGTLFIRGDEAETSWKLYTPVLEAWAASGRAGMDSYPSGSWGPSAADALLAKNNHIWRQP